VEMVRHYYKSIKLNSPMTSQEAQAIKNYLGILGLVKKVFVTNN
jgi:hypothetical protein